LNISEEKKYIYDMMRTVVDERRTLTDIYFSLKERLNDLDELERKGLSDLSIKGYVDLQNERNQTLMLENTQRELAHLKQKLEKNGATVVMTRDEDNYVDLYKRVDIAKKYDADILVSVHNNSLPDGKNPYEEHGTTTYYYHSQAENLANKVQQNLVKATQFDDKGIKHGSFVLTRPTMPVCILVEVGFMINPFEYEKLLMPKYQKIYALGIANGIKEYFK